MPHLYLPILYLDPTSGSLFVQAVIAAIVVVPFFLRNQIRRAVNRVRRTPDSPTAVATEVSAPLNAGAAPDGDAGGTPR